MPGISPVLEIAFIAVKPGTEADFEKAFAQARKLPEAIPGFRGLELRRGVEHPARYVLLAWWDRVEDHTEGFRNSPQFPQWRALLGPYFDGMPDVSHASAAL
jgi:heme-degrading monooxygenase HmoA